MVCHLGAVMSDLYWGTRVRLSAIVGIAGIDVNYHEMANSATDSTVVSYSISSSGILI